MSESQSTPVFVAPYPPDYLVNEVFTTNPCGPCTVKVLEIGENEENDKCLIIASIAGNTYAVVTYFSLKETICNGTDIWAHVAKINSDDTVEVHFTTYNPHGENPFNLSPESYIVPLLTTKVLSVNDELRTAFESKYLILTRDPCK